jgi:hypothetical protein
MAELKNMTRDEIIAECRRLRAAHEHAEAAFFVYLMRIERERDDIWKMGGCTHFDSFLRSADLCMPDRYRLFRDGVDRVGVELAVANGAHWTMQVGKNREAPKKVLEEFVARAEAFREVHETAPSPQVSREWANQLFPSDKPAAVSTQASKLRQLMAENKKLKAENISLKTENARLKEELRGKGAKKMPHMRA